MRVEEMEWNDEGLYNFKIWTVERVKALAFCITSEIENINQSQFGLIRELERIQHLARMIEELMEDSEKLLDEFLSEIDKAEK